MDRRTVYAGQLTQDIDVLQSEQFTMTAIAKFAAAVLGQTSIVNGFAVTPTGPASLNIIVGPGEIYQMENLEQSVWGSLPQDLSHSILKQGINLDPVTMGIVPPGTIGYSQNFLVEVSYADVDTGSTILPYYNAFNSSTPFSGPGNAGTAQNTLRKGIAAVQIKAGIAAATGTQTTPAADPGWVGVYVVVVAQGATTITAGNISAVRGAPIIPATLPSIPAGVQGCVWSGAPSDTGTANAMVAAYNPPILALTQNMTLIVKKSAAANTGATTIDVGTGANAVVRATGSALSSGDLPANTMVMMTWTGANWQITNFQGFNATSTTTNNFVLNIPYAVDAGGTNALACTFSPVITTLTAGLVVTVKLAHDITSASTLDVGPGARSIIRRPDLQPTQAGDGIAGATLEFEYDGTSWQLQKTYGPKVAYFFIGTFGTFNWTCPPGVYSVKATVIGGGGGGGSTLSVPGSYYGGCGGGGGYAEGVFAVVPGTVYGITTGQGGQGQTSTAGGNGSPGGTSSFSSFCSASGGTGGLGWGSPVLQGGFSGTGFGGYDNHGLGDGSTGGKLDASNSNLYAPGCGGGPGGQSGAGSGNPGWTGRGPGGGGGGTSRAEIGSAGGNGIAGSVKLEWV